MKVILALLILACPSAYACKMDMGFFDVKAKALLIKKERLNASDIVSHEQTKMDHDGKGGMCPGLMMFFYSVKVKTQKQNCVFRTKMKVLRKVQEYKITILEKNCSKT